MKKQIVKYEHNDENETILSMTALKMKDLPKADQPYEKLECNGESTLTDTELLAILLKAGVKGVPAISAAQKLLAMDFQKQGVSFLCQIPIEDLKIIPGIGRIKSIQIKAAVELGRRIARFTQHENEIIINTPSDMVKYLQEEMQMLTCEELRIALLDNKNALIKIIKCVSGSIKTTLFSPREIFKDAIKYNAASIILVHNHPSGNPKPSQSDIKTTAALSKIAKELDIPIIDHIIIGKNKYESIQAIIKGTN